MSIESLRAQHCRPAQGQGRRPRRRCDRGLSEADLPGWTKAGDGGSIAKEFRFADYFHTMAFVNAVASIAHREDHHPDLEVALQPLRRAAIRRTMSAGFR